MRRYQTPRHPIAFGAAAFALTLITLSTLVAAPAAYETAAADAIAVAGSPGHDIVAVVGTCRWSSDDAGTRED